MYSYLDFLDIINQAQTGLRCTEKDWDMRVIPKITKEKVAKYSLKYDPNTPIPNDNSLADDVFQAGFELAVEAGILCTSTQRRILFSENELKRILREAPSEIQVGQKESAVTIKHRHPDSSQPAVNMMGPIGPPVTQALFYPICLSYMREPFIDTFCGPTLEKVHDQMVRGGSPLETLAGRIDMMEVRRAALMAGKAGIAVVGIETSSTVLGHLSAAHPQFGFYPTDINLLMLQSELKTNWDQLSKALHAQMMGGIILGGSHPMIGGFVGGPEGAAIMMVAIAILAPAIYRAWIPSSFAHDLRCQGNTSLMSRWAQSIGQQALSRNTHLTHATGCSPVAGCCTEMLLYEAAATMIGDQVSGSSYLAGVRSGAGIIRNGCSGLEGRFWAELGRAVAAMNLKREEANDMVLKLTKKYMEQLLTPPKGKTFSECYDVDKCEPSQEWIQIYQKVKTDIENLGIDFNT